MWPNRIYASHPSAAFRIDARIPRLYIAHGRMTFNESRPRMFPVPRLSILFFAVIILLCSAPNARSLPQDAPGNTPSTSATQPGIDVLEDMNFAPLQGKHVGVITNQTGVDSLGRRTIDVLAHADGVKLVAIFSPEHGIAGKVDAKVENATDSVTGLPVFSLYGDTRTPTDEMLKGIDALVFDMQDAGVRFYTYTSTMGYCMEAAAKHKIPFFVLDRPNPLGGERIEGPMLDKGRISFTGYFSMPIVYGMTLGELARMFNAENKTNAELHVVAMKNWRRSQTYDQTGMKWIPPSPNLRTVGEDFIYPGIETLQPGGISVGRGTDTPFELFGAPWIQADSLQKNMEARNIPGVRFSRHHVYSDRRSVFGRSLQRTEDRSHRSKHVRRDPRRPGSRRRLAPPLSGSFRHYQADHTVGLCFYSRCADQLRSAGRDHFKLVPRPCEIQDHACEISAV